MTKSDLKALYQKRKESYSTSLEAVNKHINTISTLRVAVAIAILLTGYLGLKTYDLLFLPPLLVIVFVWLVRKHGMLFREKTHLTNLVAVQENELLALTGDTSHLRSGSEFIDVHHPYSHDLDLFGEGSIFQYINRCNTRKAKELLAARLSQKPQSVEQITQWQGAVREVQDKLEFRHELQALSMQVDDQPADWQDLRNWLTEPAIIYGRKGYRLLLNVFPVITVLLVISSFFIDGLSRFAILAAGFQWAFLGIHLKRVNKFHQHISRKKNALEKYADILRCIRKESFTSPQMTSIASRAGQGDQRVEHLASLVSAFDARLNSMTNLVVNSLLFYDLQCVYRLEKWKEENATQLFEWLAAVHETEVVVSLATFAFNHKGYSFPRVNHERRLSAKGLGHPLLPEEVRVVNDITLDQKSSVMIVTGANMAGKSTFLRSLGVNMVLALAGAPVCANEFDCPFVDLRSGMRTADSLKENQSYFYAELDRLKSIMDELRRGTPLFILLDEILKGTNSNDKQAGSIELVKQLVNYPCLVVIATHDLVLGELANSFPDRIANYSFEATIENDHLSFDYKLKRGVAQTMNATFLMKKMGIIGSK